METPAVERVYPPKVMFVLVNPLMRWLLGTSLGARVPDLARLEFKGRRTAKEYQVVAALHEIEGRLAALTNSGWRHNFADSAPITVSVGGEQREMIATLEADPEMVASVYSSRIAELGVKGSARRLGIGINVDREPTHEELVDLASREGLSVVYLDEIG